jgi:hypothetical protein
MTTKNALLFAQSLEVVCPHCEGSQPDPEMGFYLWTVEQVLGLSDEERKHTCVECDEPMRIEIVRPMPLETAKAERNEHGQDEAEEVNSKQ